MYTAPGMLISASNKKWTLRGLNPRPHAICEDAKQARYHCAKCPYPSDHEYQYDSLAEKKYLTGNFRHGSCLTLCNNESVFTQDHGSQLAKITSAISFPAPSMLCGESTAQLFESSFMTRVGKKQDLTERHSFYIDALTDTTGNHGLPRLLYLSELSYVSLQ